MAAHLRKILICYTVKWPVLDEAWMELEGDMLRLTGRYEYVKGFGHHYLAQPAVVLHKSSTLFDIKMAVTNLASVDMPLQ